MSPRPEYGEIASAEEQAAARGIPLAEELLPPPVAGTATLAPPPPGVTVIRQPTAPRRKFWDSLITTMLIMFWILTVLSSFVDLANLGLTTAAVFKSLKWGEFSSFDLAGPIGLAMNIVQCLLLAITLYLTYRATRAGRLTFWIPLATGVTSIIITSALWAIVWSSDPAFMNWFESQR